MAKIIVSTPTSVTDDKRKKIACKVAGLLGVLEDDVLVVSEGLTVSIMEVPDAMTKARADKDAKDKAEKEKAEAENVRLREKANADSAAEAAKAAKEKADAEAVKLKAETEAKEAAEQPHGKRRRE